MLVPLSCDAPIYHWPVATVGLIVTNAVAFILVDAVIGNSEEIAEALTPWLLLVHGAGIHPIQWVTSMFMHAGIMHLIGNMLFLWIFGLVVEGKVGWWRFLVIYLGIGIAQSAFEQVAMLGMEGPSYSLGASSAIYGVMAVALVWAPKNEINCFYWFAIWAMGTVDVPIMFFVLFYLVFDVFFMTLEYAATGSLMSTGFLHITGALIGAPVGLVMIKRKMVDCEGWDIFRVWNDDLPTTEKDYAEIDKQVKKKIEAKNDKHLAAAKLQFDQYMADGNVRAAVALYGKMLQVGDGMQLDRDDLVAVVKGLHERQEWGASAAFMHELISRFPDGADPVRIKLAQICVVELQKPARALELLGEVDFAKQSTEKFALAKKIARRAKQMQAEGVYELDDESL